MSEQRDDRRLTRSADNVVIAGVCAGVADYFGLNVGVLRLVTLLLILFGGLSIWVYLILWLVLPRGSRRLSGEK